MTGLPAVDARQDSMFELSGLDECKQPNNKLNEWYTDFSLWFVVVKISTNNCFQGSLHAACDVCHVSGWQSLCNALCCLFNAHAMFACSHTSAKMTSAYPGMWYRHCLTQNVAQKHRVDRTDMRSLGWHAAAHQEHDSPCTRVPRHNIPDLMALDAPRKHAHKYAHDAFPALCLCLLAYSAQKKRWLS